MRKTGNGKSRKKREKTGTRTGNPVKSGKKREGTGFAYAARSFLARIFRYPSPEELFLFIPNNKDKVINSWEFIAKALGNPVTNIIRR